MVSSLVYSLNLMVHSVFVNYEICDVFDTVKNSDKYQMSGIVFESQDSHNSDTHKNCDITEANEQCDISDTDNISTTDIKKEKSREQFVCKITMGGDKNLDISLQTMLYLLMYRISIPHRSMFIYVDLKTSKIIFSCSLKRKQVSLQTELVHTVISRSENMLELL